MSKRDDLIKTAITLFCKNGFNETSIEDVLLQANVNKMTLYKYFKSKNDLIFVVIEEYYSTIIAKMLEEIEVSGLGPKEKMALLFDKMLALSANGEVKCIFLSAFIEFSEKTNPIYKAAVKHKITIQNFIENIFKQAGCKKTNEKAKTVMCLLEGSFIMLRATASAEYYEVSKKQSLQLMIGS